MLKANSLAFILAGLVTTSCATSSDSDDYRIKGDLGKADSSVEAVFVEFEFDGQLVTDSSFAPRRAIDDQLLYTIGHLNGQDSNGVGRLDKVEVTHIETTSLESGQTLVSYHAVLPAAWGHPDDVPETHTFRLPKDISFAGQETFTEKYKEDCVDFLAHDVDAGIMWYYYRPNRFGCTVDSEDVVELTATVTLSSVNTTGKYPEYHRVWQDNTLRAVAIFGKNEEGATKNDAGITAFNNFNRNLQLELGAFELVTVPTDVSTSPGTEMPDVTYTATLPDGKTVVVTVLLIDGVRVAGPEFDDRYESLTGTADFISYAGHSGLGANIRALAQKGSWQTGQYAVVYMGGCDTYAYVDSALADAHAAVNADDDTGTKYMDIITNAQPAFFRENPKTVLHFILGLMDFENPQTFEQMFAKVDDFQVILVSGEEDNEFVPNSGGEGSVVEDWPGFDHSGTVLEGAEDRFTAPAIPGDKLATGTYVFELSGTEDADIYVRIGAAPTTSDYACRPYLSGSTETCIVELPSAASIHVMVRGWAESSDYQLTGRRQ